MKSNNHQSQQPQQQQQQQSTTDVAISHSTTISTATEATKAEFQV